MSKEKLEFSVQIDSERCKGCGYCVEACNFDVLRMSKITNPKGYRFTEIQNLENCKGCKDCYVVCPDVAISIYQK